MGDAQIKINTKIYPLEVIILASSSMLNKTLIELDGDPKDTITACLDKGYVEEFKKRLIEFSEYKKKSEKNKELRNAIIERALITDIEELDDPEGIAIPWEEKYGKDV